MMFSVIIPTYNRTDLLCNCLDRLTPDLQQLPATDYEIIVTDDGSDGITEKVLKDRYAWVNWVAGPQRGPASNRNNGAKQAQGEWLIFFDDDCQPDADVLKQYKQAVELNPNVLVFEGAIYCDEIIKSPLYASPVNSDGGFLWSCNFSIKKTVFDDVRGFDENFKFANLEDNDLHYRLKQKGYDVLFVKDAKVNHPPRSVAKPEKYAIYHESWLYYHKKIGQNKTVSQLLVTILRNRLSSIKNYPFTKDSITAFFNLIKELWLTFLRYGLSKSN